MKAERPPRPKHPPRPKKERWRISDDMADRIAQAYADGVHIRTIVVRFKVGIVRLFQIVDARGIPRRGRYRNALARPRRV